MPLVPHRFLLRVAYVCPYVKDMPGGDDDELFAMPASARIDNFAAIDGERNFAEVHLAWNELGLGLQVQVRGKEKPLQGDAARPRNSDGVTLWIDTRDARASHRASRYCHQFHFLPTGGGPESDQPVFVQTKINRALEDAPLAHEVPYLLLPRTGGYTVQAFLPAAALHGYDPEQHPRLGFYYVVRDDELGEQGLSVGPEFPFWEDPSLWSVLELVR